MIAIFVYGTKTRACYTNEVRSFLHFFVGCF